MRLAVSNPGLEIHRHNSVTCVRFRQKIFQHAILKNTHLLLGGIELGATKGQ
jgi:hypothetical protein